MHPVLKNKWNFIAYEAAVLLFAALYAILFGLQARAGTGCIVADAVAFWGVFGLMGIILWNISNYMIPMKGMRGLRAFMITATGLLMTAITLGGEALALYLASHDGSIHGLSSTIFLRILVIALSYTILYQYYHRDCERNRAQEKASEPAPQPHGQTDTIERITIRGGKNIKVIGIDDIEYIQADGDYVTIITSGGKWMKEQTMKYFEENLPRDRFVRVHRSYIVNLGGIVKLERYGNLYQVSLRNGENIKVSANGYKVLKSHLKL